MSDSKELSEALYGYCCGFIGGTNKHQLWCQKHPDRYKGKEASTAKSNSDQAMVDDIARGVASSLEQHPNRWNVSPNKNNNDWLRDGTFAVDVSGGVGCVRVSLEGSGMHYEHVTRDKATASQEAIWTAYKAWQEKRLVAHINRAPPPPPPPPVPPVPREPGAIERVWVYLFGSGGNT